MIKQKTMITAKMVVEKIDEKTSDLRSGSVTKAAVRHGIKTEMPFIDQVIIKTIKEDRWIKEQRKRLVMNVTGRRRDNRRKE